MPHVDSLAPTRTAPAWIGALAVALLALAALLVPARPAAAAGPDLLPDLVAPPPTNPRLSVEPLPDGQQHLLLRFAGYLRNAGAGPLEIRGSSPSNGVLTQTFQRIFAADGSHRDDYSRHPLIRYENADGHDHWHLQAATRFTLWNEAGTQPVAPGAKVGFCLEDVEKADPSAGAADYSTNATQYCMQGTQTGSIDLFEGISPGWQDVYNSRLPFQWVDVTDVAPGRYRLGAQVDPDNFMIESDEQDNGPTLGPDVVTLPGYVPVPGTVSLRAAHGITLGALSYGTPGQAQFRIEAGPRHGKLSAAPGTALPAPEVVYTPGARFAGTDTFTFSVRDASNPYPVHVPTATVTVEVPLRLAALSKRRFLSRVRFKRKGRYLVVRARAKRSGMVRIRVGRSKRPLGSCARRARAGRAFRCRVKLRRHASVRHAKVVALLYVRGKAAAVNTFRVRAR